MGLSDAEVEEAAELLRGGPRVAFERGAAPLLLKALANPVGSILGADRAGSYVTVLYALLLLRRDHEIEPLHEDVARAVGAAARGIDPSWDDQVFGRDVDQLILWGCIERRTEPLKIRGYKDVRRERFRYRLTEDAVALLEWLEARLEARLEGRAPDSRDLMIDVLGSIKELTRVVSQWHAGERGEELPRRALHLLTSIDERVHAIGEELLTFRAAMVAFASRPYDLAALGPILAWLDRYVSVYLARIEVLRAEIAEKLAALGAPRFERALADQYALVSRERATAPLAFRAAGVLRDPKEMLETQRTFFADRGRLLELSMRIDESARAVLRKMHRHLRELERRGARIGDLRARVAELCTLAGDSPDPRVTAFMNQLVGSAHARFASRKALDGARALPPLPRQHTPSSPGRSAQPLSEKQLQPEAARELRQRRLADLRLWLERELLKGSSSVRLSEAELSGPDAPRRWLDVARARLLDRGRALGRLAVTIADASGTAIVGSTGKLLAPDCIVSASRRDER
jgi:hypothetical protein